MKMTYSIASKYSKYFEIMGDPYTLIILDYLFENRTAKTVDDLVSVSKGTQSKVSAICEELCDLSVLDKEYEGSTVTYQAIDTSYSRFIQRIIEYID